MKNPLIGEASKCGVAERGRKHARKGRLHNRQPELLPSLGETTGLVLCLLLVERMHSAAYDPG